MSPNPLDVLKNLQDRVAALEQQLGDPPGADSLQPNVITVNPDGTIGALFTGGVQLNEAQASPPPESMLDWKRQDGSDAGGIYMLNQAGIDALTVLIHAAGHGGAGDEYLDIIRGNGVSSFLQLLSAQKLRVDHGTAQVSWAGGTPFTNAPTINHGLGVVPSRLLVTPDVGSTNWALGTFGQIAASFRVAGHTADGSSPAAGTQASFHWIALG